MAKYLFGIDFGSCNIKCVRADKNKVRPVQLNTEEGNNSHTPNAIYYRTLQSGEVENVIGQFALNLGIMEPKNLIVGLKRKLEQKNWQRFIPTLNRNVTAVEAANDIFKKIYAFASKKFSADDEAVAVVTVPIIFTKHQRQLIKSAAENAGFKVVSVVNESFASIFAMDAQEDSINLIFDFGGSTLDISVIKFGKDEVQELAAVGLEFGGLDIDRDILEKILNPQFADELNARWQGDTADDFKMNFVRRLKENLFADDFKDSADAFIVDASFNFKLFRADVEKLFASEGYGERIVKLLDELFEELSQGADCLDKTDVEKVWAIGGTLHIPYFRNLLENYFGAELFDAQDYDFDDTDDLIEGLDDKYLIVAAGAAEFLKNHDSITAINAVPYRICYKVGKSFNLGIAKNMPVDYETMYLGLKFSELEKSDWKIELYQTFSDEIKFENAAYLGEVQLNPALYEKNSAIVFMTMKMMRDGSLRLRFFERRMVGQEADITLVDQFYLNV